MTYYFRTDLAIIFYRRRIYKEKLMSKLDKNTLEIILDFNTIGCKIVFEQLRMQSLIDNRDRIRRKIE